MSNPNVWTPGRKYLYRAYFFCKVVDYKIIVITMSTNILS